MKLNRLQLVLLFVALWFVLEMGFFLSSEIIVKVLFPGTHTVGHWLYVTGLGMSLILILCAVAYILASIVRKRKSNTTTQQ